MNLKKYFITAIAGAMILGTTPVSAANMNVTKRTRTEVRNYIKKSKGKLSTKIAYSKKPSTKKPYSAGQLSSGTLDSALGMTNQIRYVAGIDYNVQLDSNYTKRIQTGVLVNAVNKVMSHYPGKPSGMSQDMYDTGLNGTMSSNLAMGFSTLGSAIIDGWMYDSDSSNISALGHRRWMLDPSMKKTGFGAVNSYTGMYVIGDSIVSSDQRVAWPAQTMPLEYFSKNSAWSLSTGRTEDSSKIKVTITRSSDHKKWNFSKNSSNGYFNVNNDGYGQEGCIVFRPSNLGTLKHGQKYNVKVTGLTEGTLSYTVDFFALNEITTPKTAKISKVKAYKKKAKVSWKKVSGASKYQVRYATKKSMKSAKTKTVGSSSRSKTITKLKSKKRYYFQVRAYKTSQYQTKYGNWSSKKSVKVK